MRNTTSHLIQDYIRAAAVNLNSPDSFYSGSYDHTIRMWDVRSNQTTMSMNHGDPVESLLSLPGGTILISAGGSTVKVWDVLAGGRLLHTVSNHTKTITCL